MNKIKLRESSQMIANILLMVLVSMAAISPVQASNSPDINSVRVKRLHDGPIIYPQLDSSLGNNIQGPSLIRVPEWVSNPLGRYYLYFADHKGRYIRLAYADQLTGPWKIYTPGTLKLEQTDFPQKPQALSAQQVEHFKVKMQALGIDAESLPHDPLLELTTPHIASPDVHVDDVNKRIVMYFHGLKRPGYQVSRVATSRDGISFTPSSEDLGKTYMRAFKHQGMTYSLAMPGQFYRSQDGISDFEAGPLLFNRNMRHAGVLKRGDNLWVFWTQVGDAPERILMSRIDITKPWMQWQVSETVEVLRPELTWEGADAPVEPSVRSVAYGHVNQLRDPYIFEEAGRTYLLYVVAGESGIAIAEFYFTDDNIKVASENK
jgi:hypothetical protein